MEIAALEIENLSKTFPGQRALDSVSLAIRAGEIHALVGENGSGKSTLIKCLAGVYHPDTGSKISIKGAELPLPYSSAEAQNHGCVFIHQDLGLIDGLSVAENLALSTCYDRRLFGRIRWRQQADRARAALAAFGDHIDPKMLVGRLSMADKTLVAIARGMRGLDSGNQTLLVLDEPTAALPASEVDALFAALRRIARSGISIMYVSHRLAEIFALTDRITVLRDGRNVATVNTSDLDHDHLVQLIVGKPIQKLFPSHDITPKGPVVLTADGLCGTRAKNVSLTLHAGEIVGVAGLLGSGRSELGRLICGAQALSGGAMTLDGRPYRPKSARDAIQRGVLLVPEDRKVFGSHQELNLAENITLSRISHVRPWGQINKNSERREVNDLISKFNVRPGHPTKLFRTFSGGNQQKAVLAKWLRLDPTVLVLDEPTQGVDIGSRTEIYQFIREAVEHGTSVLMIDSDMEELSHMCDRVLVLERGTLIAELPRTELSVDALQNILFTGKKASA